MKIEFRNIVGDLVGTIELAICPVPRVGEIVSIDLVEYKVVGVKYFLNSNLCRVDVESPKRYFVDALRPFL